MQSFIKNPELKFLISENDVIKSDTSNQSNETRPYSLEFTKDELELLEKIDQIELKESDQEIPFKSPKKRKGKTFEITFSELKSIKSQLLNDKYLCDVLDKINLKLPENETVERNPELEKRIQRLRAQQANREYDNMTKNVDSSRKNAHPDDTIAYQMKQINRQLIAVAQFIFSVAAGFVFGFIGVELIVGELDFGFRLLLGIMCALIIALAEIYFLAKKLIEEEREEEKANTTEVKGEEQTSPTEKKKN